MIIHNARRAPLSSSGRPGPLPRGPAPCQAVERKAKGGDKVQVPGAPPSKESTPTEVQASTAEEVEVEVGEPQQIPSEGESMERMSAEEIRQQVAELRAVSMEAQAKEGLMQGVMEEVGLIKWPSPQSALLNTLLVIAIVAGTSVVLFGVNTGLAELSRAVYSRL